MFSTYVYLYSNLNALGTFWECNKKLFIKKLETSDCKNILQPVIMKQGMNLQNVAKAWVEIAQTFAASVSLGR